MTKYGEGQRRLAELREQIGAARAEMRKVIAAIEPQPADDYVFSTIAGPRRLSELFGESDHLFIVHNMGSSCPYCTLWADGYNGIYHHLATRAAFVVSSPDPPEVQQEFAASRGWSFPLVSHRGTTFAADMGYRSANGGWLPGISAFERHEGRMVRVSDTASHPGDDLCALWHIFDLLPQGAGSWSPRLSYGSTGEGIEGMSTPVQQCCSCNGAEDREQDH